MTKNLEYGFSCLFAIVLVGCESAPSMGLGAPEVRGGKFSDTPGNRVLSERAYRHLIDAELSGRFQGVDWKEDWRRAVKAVEEGDENPEDTKRLMRKLRAEYGLPVWDFMY